MMFTRVVALAIASIPLLAAATPLETRNGSGGSDDAQCCDSVTQASDPSAAAILSLLGVVLQDVNVLVGLNCSPIDVVDVGSGACSNTAVSCTDNSHGSLIAIGCLPITA